MIKVDIVFMEDEAIGILKSRGLEVRKVEIVDDDDPEKLVVDVWQVMNPFTGRWEKARGVFWLMIDKAVKELIREKVMEMDLHECFKNEL